MHAEECLRAALQLHFIRMAFALCCAGCVGALPGPDNLLAAICAHTPSVFVWPTFMGAQDVFRSEDAVLDGSRFAQLDELLSKTDLYTKFLRLVCSKRAYSAWLSGDAARFCDMAKQAPLCCLRSEQMSAIEARTDAEAGEAGTCRKRKANGKAGGARNKGPGAAAISTHVRVSALSVQPDYDDPAKWLVVWATATVCDFFCALEVADGSMRGAGAAAVDRGRTAAVPAEGCEVAHLAVPERAQRHPG